MTKPIKIKSNFAILDVLGPTSGTNATLRKRLKNGDYVPVAIKGRINSIHGNHDGVSQEFEIEVLSVEEINEVQNV